jgi:hypothetical protein
MGTHTSPSDSEPDLPLRNARQGAAARGIHDLQALADGELTPRGSPGPARVRRWPDRRPEDTTSAERVSK